MATTRAFSAARYGKMLFNAQGVRKPSIGTMGESHGIITLPYAIQYACARYFHADVVFDTRTYANGGTVFAVGGTTMNGANGLVAQAAQFALRPTDIVFIASGYNDTPSAATAAALALVQQGVAQQCFTAGASTVIIVGMTPFPTQDVVGWESFQFLMKNWCAKTQGAYFLDITSVVASMNQAAGSMAYRVTGAGLGSYTEDGTHWSGYAGRLISPLIANILKGLCPERLPRTNFAAGAYDPATKPWINVLGDVGNCLGTAGTYKSVFDTGVVGTSSASRLDLSQFATGVSTNSIVTGANGENKQRCTMSGVADVLVASMSPTITNVNNSDPTRLYDYECVVDLNAITGLSDILIRPFSSSFDMPSKNNAGPSLWDDATSAQLFYYSMAPFAMSGNNPNITMYFSFFKAPSGSFDLSRMSLQRVV